jgi:hypothetical protein
MPPVSPPSSVTSIDEPALSGPLIASSMCSVVMVSIQRPLSD